MNVKLGGCYVIAFNSNNSSIAGAATVKSTALNSVVGSATVEYFEVAGEERSTNVPV
jgi:hypothetical protein